MNDEKRMIEGYEVKQSLQVGGKEIVLAEDMKSQDAPYMVCDCRWDNPLGVDFYEKAVGGDDYLDVLKEFTTRVNAAVSEIEAERDQRGIGIVPLTVGDCIVGSQHKHYENQLVVIRPEVFSPERRTADYQLVIATGGFGCDPEARGSAVFCKNLFSGKETRFERRDIAGIIHPDSVPEWAAQKLAALEKVASMDKPSIRAGLNEAKKAVPMQDDKAEKSKGHEL